MYNKNDGDIGIVSSDEISNQTISADDTLKSNIEKLIFPGANTKLFNLIKNLALILIILYIVIEGAKLVIQWKEGKDIKESAKNLWYIALGAVFIRWASWLFGTVFTVEQTASLQDLSDKAQYWENSLVWNVLSLLKAGAFFFAIIMTVITWFKVISAWDGEKGKLIAKGIINIVVSLLIIKGVDYVYYIASQSNFIESTTELIKKVAKVFGYLYGVTATGIVIFAGYSLITDNGSGEWMKRAKGRLINLAVSWIALFGFLLILYQLFNEFNQ